jgi:mono/diheme cytochrome c family protein
MITASKTMALAALASLMVAGQAGAATDRVAAALGHDLAQQFCTTCHLIEAGQKNPPGHVGGPSFQTVADRPDTTRESLRHHLTMTHTNAMIPLQMPNPQLSEDELVKIISYLMSLKTQP